MALPPDKQSSCFSCRNCSFLTSCRPPLRKGIFDAFAKVAALQLEVPSQDTIETESVELVEQVAALQLVMEEASQDEKEALSKITKVTSLQKRWRRGRAPRGPDLVDPPPVDPTSWTRPRGLDLVEPKSLIQSRGPDMGATEQRNSNGANAHW